jgi:N-methylhydantoinase A
VILGVDVGGTFTDAVVLTPERLFTGKSATTPADQSSGVMAAVSEALDAARASPRDVSRFVHGMTVGTNALLEGRVARTALLATEGFTDLEELGRQARPELYRLCVGHPPPLVPASLRVGVPERCGPEGVLRPLDEDALLAALSEVREAGCEAVAVCLLWSIVNPEHEVRVGELLAEHMPEAAVTLSHQVNPCLREYRRASSTAIDASLKPVMAEYVGGLRVRLRDQGFSGRVLIVTSAGGALDAEDIAAAPIHSLNSGPAMAPVAGRFFAGTDAESDMAIVADTGGTSYDVSVVRRGRIPWTRESWIGAPYFGHMTGFPAVDVRSVGSGGGSIAHVDAGGLLHVGPESAGADPGPVCYAQGGERPTTTDACLVLGLLDPAYFLGGRTKLDLDAAREAIRKDVGEPLGLDEQEAAGAILRVATERMVSAIEEITIHEGIDPRRSVLVGGGGAAGFNTVAIARQLGCPEVLIPALGPALSAAGALISELSRTYEMTLPATDTDFDYDAVNEALAELQSRADAFIAGPGEGAIASSVEFSVEARYPQQVWELEVPHRAGSIDGPEDLNRLCEDFHAVHRDVFAIADEGSPIEFQSWHARVRCRLAEPAAPQAEVIASEPAEREIYLPGVGPLKAAVWRIESVPLDEPIAGPAIVEMPTTTVLIDPEASFARRKSGTLRILPQAGSGGAQPVGSGTERTER